MVRRVGVLAMLSAWATVAMPGAVTGRQPPAALPPSAYLDDFDSAWTFIRDNYAYFEEKSVDWEQVRNLLSPRATGIRDRGEFIGLLEDLDVVIDEALERDPAGSDAQGVTDALGDHHLVLRSYHIRHGMTSPR